MYPEDAYILAIGKLAYSVTYLEGQILFDLPHLPGLPTQLDVRSLAGRSTGQLGRIFQDQAVLSQVADLQVRAWLQAGGKHLSEAARLRNAVLHARPATVNGEQRLHRWHPDGGEIMNISST